MKQTVAIMAIFLVLLLVVSGFIVSGSLQQSEMLAQRVNQVSELNQKLQKQVAQQRSTNADLEETTLALTQATAERDALKQNLQDALLAVEEANGAVAQQSSERQQVETAFAGERSDLIARLGEAETLAQELTDKLNEASQKRDQLMKERELLNETVEKSKTERKAITEELTALRTRESQLLAEQETLVQKVTELQTANTSALQEAAVLKQQQEKWLEEKKALNAELAQAKKQLKTCETALQTLTEQHQKLTQSTDGMKQETEAFVLALASWQAAQKGDAQAMADWLKAAEDFRKAYPNSFLVLPAASEGKDVVNAP
ncbi:MAG: hypothetical protein PHI98_00885 [Eubacteriales bacterium]|nr:hypothetical protein [Eubacteriales bacterium]